MKFSEYEIKIMKEVLEHRKNQLERERNVWRVAHQHDFVQSYDSLIGDIDKVLKKLEGL